MDYQNNSSTDHSVSLCLEDGSSSNNSNQIFINKNYQIDTKKNNLTDIQFKQALQNINQTPDILNETSLENYFQQNEITVWNWSNIKIFDMKKLNEQNQMLLSQKVISLENSTFSDDKNYLEGTYNSKEYNFKFFTGGLLEFQSICEEILILKQFSDEEFIQMRAVSYRIQNGKLRLFIAFEKYDYTLEDYIQKNIKDNLEEETYFFLNISKALEKLHNKSIILKNFNPNSIKIIEKPIKSNQNLSVSPQKSIAVTRIAKLSDYFIQDKINFDNLEKNTTQIKYCSPEHIQDKCVTAKANVWSLGLIMYETLTKKQIYSQINENNIQQYIQNSDNPFQQNWEKSIDNTDIIEIIKQSVNFNESIYTRITIKTLYDQLQNTVQRNYENKHYITNTQDEFNIGFDSTALKHVNESIKYLIVQSYEEALKQIDQALKIEPYFSRAYNIKGSILNAQGKKQEAIQLYDRALLHNDKFYHAYYNKGNTLQELFKFKESIENYNKALNLNPKCQETLYHRGLSYKETDQYQEAIKDFQSILSQNDVNIDVIYELGLCYYELGNYKKANKSLDQCISLDDQYYQAYDGKGDIFYKLNQFPEAIEMYIKVTEIQEDYKDAYLKIGYIYFQQKKFDIAQQQFDKVLQLDPQNIDAMINNATIQKMQNNLKEALSQFNIILVYEPNSINALQHKAHILQKQKKHNLALESYQKIIELDDSLKEVYNNQGISYLHLKKTEQALNSFQKALSFDQNYQKARLNIGTAQIELKQYHEAINTLDLYLKSEKNSAEAYSKRGYCYYKIQMYHQSLSMFQTALNLDKNNKLSLKYIEIVREKYKQLQNTIQQ